MRQRGKIRNYQRGNQYPPKEQRRRKSMDQEKELEKQKNKMLVQLQSMKSKVRSKVKVEMKMDFQKTTRGCFNCDFYFLTNVLLLFFVQL